MGKVDAKEKGSGWRYLTLAVACPVIAAGIYHDSIVWTTMGLWFAAFSLVFIIEDGRE